MNTFVTVVPVMTRHQCGQTRDNCGQKQSDIITSIQHVHAGQA